MTEFAAGTHARRGTPAPPRRALPALGPDLITGPSRRARVLATRRHRPV